MKELLPHLIQFSSYTKYIEELARWLVHRTAYVAPVAPEVKRVLHLTCVILPTALNAGTQKLTAT